MFNIFSKDGFSTSEFELNSKINNSSQLKNSNLLKFTSPNRNNTSTIEIPTLDFPSASYIWVIIVVNAGIILTALFIAGFCCRRGTAGFSISEGPYYYMPKPWLNQISLQSSVVNVLKMPGDKNPSNNNLQIIISDCDYDQTHMEAYNSDSTSLRLPPFTGKTSDYRDYMTTMEEEDSKQPENSMVPVFHVISEQQFDVKRRLGGGVFGDSYLALWRKRKVVAKRVVVGFHGDMMINFKQKWIIQSVSQLAKLRHKNLVSVLGVCVETNQPYIIQEFVEWVCLKKILPDPAHIESLSWKKKLKIAKQVADAMGYLHSIDPPILHRDLRCANVFVSNGDKTKLGDYGFTKIFQILRNYCKGTKNCFCSKETSAFPSTIRWTAPEVLGNPRAEEATVQFFKTLNDMSLSTQSIAEKSSMFVVGQEEKEEETLGQFSKDYSRNIKNARNDSYIFYRNEEEEEEERIEKDSNKFRTKSMTTIVEKRDEENEEERIKKKKEEEKQNLKRSKLSLRSGSFKKKKEDEVSMMMSNSKRSRWSLRKSKNSSFASSGVENYAAESLGTLSGEVLTTSCDAYSFGMMMWELASRQDPFQDVVDEQEVKRLVLEGFRPCPSSSSSSSSSIFPSSHYRDLMEVCWQENAEARPSFKQIYVALASISKVVDNSIEGNDEKKQNITNSYLRTAFNLR